MSETRDANLVCTKGDVPLDQRRFVAKLTEPGSEEDHIDAVAGLLQHCAIGFKPSLTVS